MRSYKRNLFKKSPAAGYKCRRTIIPPVPLFRKISNKEEIIQEFGWWKVLILLELNKPVESAKFPWSESGWSLAGSRRRRSNVFLLGLCFPRKARRRDGSPPLSYFISLCHSVTKHVWKLYHNSWNTFNVKEEIGFSFFKTNMTFLENKLVKNIDLGGKFLEIEKFLVLRARARPPETPCNANRRINCPCPNR